MRCVRFTAAGLAALLVACAPSAEDAGQADSASATATSSAAVSGTAAAEGALAEVRLATERYRDVEEAVADGYLRDPMNVCVLAATEGQPRQLGGMGIHYFRPDLLGITATEPRVAGTGTHTDFLRPGVLLYEPQADGSLELVAVENLAFAEAWHAAGNEGPPTFHGLEYYHMVDNPHTEADEAHMFEPHYELHAWLYRENPLGTFSPFNPTVTCEHHDGPTTLPSATD